MYVAYCLSQLSVLASRPEFSLHASAAPESAFDAFKVYR